MRSGSKKNVKLYQLLCKWNDCDTPSFIVPISDYDAYGNHLRMHIDSSVNVANAVYARMKPQDEESQLIFTCEWQGCNIEMFTDALQFTRHVMYHGYHSKLKDIGRQEQEKSKYGPCQLDEETKDYLPDLSDPFICYWEDCGTEFQCPLDFFSHVDAHALRTEASVVDDPEEYFNGYMCKWNDCNCSFKTVYKLKEHCRVHTHEKLIACPVCGGFFANRTKFIDHLSRQDSDSYENFQCSHCLRRCASERLLRDHMRHHVNHLKCPQCDMTCPNPSSLRDHIRFRHSQERPYACEVCSFRCKTSSDLQRHEETHLGNQYSCAVEGCNFTTKTLQYLKNHHRNKHETIVSKKFVCHICDSRYTRGTGLTTHLKAKHNFRWPSGHPRFRYKEYEDGLFRLQMVRFESAELTEKLSEGEIIDEECIEEVLDVQDQDDYMNSNEAVQQPDIIINGNSAIDPQFAQDAMNLIALTSIQETLSRAQIIWTVPNVVQPTSEVTNAYQVTSEPTQTTPQLRSDLSLQLLQMATAEAVSEIATPKVVSLEPTTTNLAITGPSFSSPAIETSASVAHHVHVSENLNAISVPAREQTEAVTSQNQQEVPNNEKKGKKRKASPNSGKKKKKVAKSVSEKTALPSLSKAATDDRSDYDQRLDISHTLLSLHSNGLIRL